MDLFYEISGYFYFGSLAVFFVFLLILSLLFYTEKEVLASKRALYLAMVFLIYGILSYSFFPDILILIDCLAILVILCLLLFPFPLYKSLTDNKPLHRFDERDIMFSRSELVPGTDQYLNYYARHPEKEVLDNAFRKLPGLLSKDALYYHKKAFTEAKQIFKKINTLAPQIDGNVSSEQAELPDNEISQVLKKMILKKGALNVGISPCKDFHFYSHKGRGNEYGNSINNEHEFAIAFTVEMDQEMVAAAPKASIVLESARQYLNAGQIAIETAKYIRNLGFEARAHIDGNYQLICPLVARDAGLGEIGRMGILMTPKEGPRVRIGVVTTSLKLIPDQYTKNHALIDFCNRCKKCADCCPSSSIPFDEPKNIDGVKRWKIDSESCFTFWCKTGTDCGRCMAVCPYSHPNNSLHKLIRWGIQHSRIFRIIAVYLDDLFYGKKPKPKPLPKFLAP